MNNNPTMQRKKNFSLSLFSGAGIGDIGFRAAGFNFIAMNELDKPRLDIAKINFPNAKMFVGDIWEMKNSIIQYATDFCASNKAELSLITCTAPCQGMSKNGQGTLLKNIREGKRPKQDPRNRLIIPALEIIKELKPLMVVFENVIEMRRTLIEDKVGNYVPILQLISEYLQGDYAGKAYDIEFADYGIPQRRQRLITVYSRLPKHKEILRDGGELVPRTTHSKSGGEGKKRWVSVSEALHSFPQLDAASKDKSHDLSIAFHRVPVLDALKYSWVANTPPGRSAFDNQCTKCGFQENPLHTTARNSEGINQSSKTTPLYCINCGEMLPRPSTDTPNGRRIMSGFTSAYKRMAADLPAPALTRNFTYACSDQKIHPYQNRVLSIAEALTLQTISDYDYDWGHSDIYAKNAAPDSLIRLVIGESIPPRFLELLGKYLLSTKAGEVGNLNLKQQKSFSFEGA